MGVTQILFWFLSILALGSALMVIISKNPVHSVLWLIVTFFAISGHYILLNAQTGIRTQEPKGCALEAHCVDQTCISVLLAIVTIKLFV